MGNSVRGVDRSILGLIMAFQKGIDVRETGLEATHWVLGEVRLNMIADTVMLYWHGYKDAAAYASGKASLSDKIHIQVTGASSEGFNGAMTSLKNKSQTHSKAVAGSVFADAAEVAD